MLSCVELLHQLSNFIHQPDPYLSLPQELPQSTVVPSRSQSHPRCRIERFRLQTPSLTMHPVSFHGLSGFNDDNSDTR